MSALAERLQRAPAVRTVLDGLPGADAWLVGGTVRDALRDDAALDEPDLVVAGEAEPVARALAERVGAFVFPLSERFGAWRVIAHDRSWQSDITPARGTIDEDLALRDFTINAMAVPTGDLSRLIDPHDGAADLDAGTIRAVGPRTFADDPLRVLRMARFACDLGFEIEADTAGLAAADAARIDAVAPERSFYELRRLITGPGSAPWDRADGLRGAGRHALAGAGSAQGCRAEPLPPGRRVGPHAGRAGSRGRGDGRSGRRAR